MKALIRDYVASLRERDELDAVLPDLMSELGLNVFSRPGRGTTQKGVDIAAVGNLDGEDKVYLVTVKPGNIDRVSWHGSDQAVRPSLEQILDAYIPHRLAEEHRNRKVVIVLAFGGIIHEAIREDIKGFQDRNTTERISFEEWNGDKIAGLIEKGILREELLPKELRSSFQKAVAMVDEPEVSYAHFRALARKLRERARTSARAEVLSARQLNLCLWVLFVWARDAKNVEAPYRASELALLWMWDLIRTTLANGRKPSKEILGVLVVLIQLHESIADEWLSRVLPHVKVEDGVASAIGAFNPVDINLALFETLGRLALAGLWKVWYARGAGRQFLGEGEDAEGRTKALEAAKQYLVAGLDLIKSNGALGLPISDQQSTAIALFLQLWLELRIEPELMAAWVEGMAGRFIYTVTTNGRYPTIATDYADLVEHPGEGPAYFQSATAASTLIPILAVWLWVFDRVEAASTLAHLVNTRLPHCTLQLWTPDAASEANLYLNTASHGIGVTGLELDENYMRVVIDFTVAAIQHSPAFGDLTAVKSGFWPLVLVACRHYGLPVPPHFWASALTLQPAEAIPADPQAE